MSRRIDDGRYSGESRPIDPPTFAPEEPVYCADCTKMFEPADEETLCDDCAPRLCPLCEDEYILPEAKQCIGCEQLQRDDPADYRRLVLTLPPHQRADYLAL